MNNIPSEVTMEIDRDNFYNSIPDARYPVFPTDGTGLFLQWLCKLVFVLFLVKYYQCVQLLQNSHRPTVKPPHEQP